MQTFILVFIFQISCVSMLLHIDSGGVSLHYSITLSDRCRVGKDRFVVSQGYSINKCVIECSLRSHCKVLNFVQNMKMCELFSSHGTKGSFKKGNCLFVKRSHMKNITTPCGACKYGEVCDTSTKICTHRECVPVSKPANGTILGNLRGIGNSIRYKCDPGFIVKNGIKSATCLTNGSWSRTVECIKDCGEPYIDQAHISDGQTVEGSVRTVTCYSNTFIDINKVKSEIRCERNGYWTPDIICSKFNSVIFRVIPGNGASTFSAWNNGTDTTSDVLCRDVSNTKCKSHYRDPRIDKWDILDIQTVRYSIYNGSNEVAWILFNGTGSSKTDWFQQGRVIDSSYNGLSSVSTFNYFDIEPYVLQRHFYVSVAFHTCEGDIFFLVTVDGYGNCWYDKLNPYPVIMYSELNTSASTGKREHLGYGDTAVVAINN